MDNKFIVEALENIADKVRAFPNNCRLFGEWPRFDFILLLSNAANRLKKQEAVEPSFKQDEKGIFIWCCGSCGAYMYHIYDGIDKAKEYAKYCRQCGKKVKWE